MPTPHLVISPNPGNFGTGVVGSPIPLTIHIHAVFYVDSTIDEIEIVSVTVDDAVNFSVSGIVLPFDFEQFGGPTQTTLIVTCNPAAPGTYNTNLRIGSSSGGYVIPLTALFLAAGVGLGFVPSSVN